MPFHAAEAATGAGVAHCRLLRPPWTPLVGDRWHHAATLAAAAEALPALGAERVFLALGRQSLQPFAGSSGRWFLVRAIEPLDAVLPDAEVVLDRGPFDVDDEVALLTRHRVDTVVTKNSGGTAAEAKLVAARRLGLPRRDGRPAAPARRRDGRHGRRRGGVVSGGRPIGHSARRQATAACRPTLPRAGRGPVVDDEPTTRTVLMSTSVGSSRPSSTTADLLAGAPDLSSDDDRGRRGPVPADDGQRVGQLVRAVAAPGVVERDDEVGGAAAASSRRSIDRPRLQDVGQGDDAEVVPERRARRGLAAAWAALIPGSTSTSTPCQRSGWRVELLQHRAGHARTPRGRPTTRRRRRAPPRRGRARSGPGRPPRGCPIGARRPGPRPGRGRGRARSRRGRWRWPAARRTSGAHQSARAGTEPDDGHAARHRRSGYRCGEPAPGITTIEKYGASTPSVVGQGSTALAGHAGPLDVARLVEPGPPTPAPRARRPGCGPPSSPRRRRRRRAPPSSASGAQDAGQDRSDSSQRRQRRPAAAAAADTEVTPGHDRRRVAIGQAVVEVHVAAVEERVALAQHGDVGPASSSLGHDVGGDWS